jgi:aspartate aminotransferase
MAHKLADRVSTIAPSATLAIAARAANLRAQGHKVFPFGVGEPDFATPAHIRAAAAAAVERGATHYTPVAGTPELKAAICAATERDRGYRPDPDQVVVGCGAKDVLFNIALALYEPGDEVVVPAPYWVSYPEQVRIAGATPVILPTLEDDGFRVQPDALARALTPRTKAVILCSPSNPTGAAYSAAHLVALVDVLLHHDCFIITDEIYAELVYDGFRHTSLATLAGEKAADLADRVIVVDGVSKTYAMTGWRVGWCIAAPRVAAAIEIVQGQSITHTAAVSQAAAVAALNGPRDEVNAMRKAFASRRTRMVEGLRGTKGIRCRMPEGAFYAFADVRGLYGLEHAGHRVSSDEEVAGFLLDRAHVAAVPGTPFGAPGYLRFSYACSEGDIDGGIQAMRDAIRDG